MNIANSVSDVQSEQVNTIAFYVNVHFNQLATDVDNGTLSHQFDGKGRKMVMLDATQEATYLSYSSDKAGKDILTPPFELYAGDSVVSTLQEAPSQSSSAKYKWRGIIQDNFNLQQTDKKSDTKVTYQAALPEGTQKETDTVSIFVKFSLNGKKYAVGWDPKIRVIKR